MAAAGETVSNCSLPWQQRGVKGKVADPPPSRSLPTSSHRVLASAFARGLQGGIHDEGEGEVSVIEGCGMKILGEHLCAPGQRACPGARLPTALQDRPDPSQPRARKSVLHLPPPLSISHTRPSQLVLSYRNPCHLSPCTCSPLFLPLKTAAMKLDATDLRYISPESFRVLAAVRFSLSSALSLPWLSLPAPLQGCTPLTTPC